jgi:hypothetical protein
VDPDILWLAPAHRDTGIGRDELEPLRFRDDVNIDHAVELLAKLVADSSVQNNIRRQASLLPNIEALPGLRSVL